MRRQRNERPSHHIRIRGKHRRDTSPVAPKAIGYQLASMRVGLIGKLSGMPSHQSPDHGYSRMVEEPAIYALTLPAKPWVDWPDPEPHRTIDAALYAAGQADALVQYNAYKKVYDSQENIHHFGHLPFPTLVGWCYYLM